MNFHAAYMRKKVAIAQKMSRIHGNQPAKLELKEMLNPIL